MSETENRSEMLGEKEKVQILLQEYSTLRSELVANGTKTFQMAALVGALLTLTLGRPVDNRFWIAALVGVVGLFALGFTVVRDIKRLNRRVTELEAEINRRAGEELLVWESRWGAVATGFIFPRQPLPPKGVLLKE